MSRYLLDSDHLSLYYRGHPAMLAHLSRHPPGDVVLSVVAAEESLRGWLNLLSRHPDGLRGVQAYASLLRAIDILHQFQIVPFDAACDQRFQQLCSQVRRVGRPDLKIAAIALANNLIVVTGNRRDFGQVPGLIVEDWSVP
jgi:tRNA(fMet)-specific endonuclease VapC